MTMNCKHTLQLLDDYIDGLLDEADRRAMVQHLGGCQSCHDELDAEQALRRVLHDLPAPTPAPEFFDRIFSHAAEQAGQQRTRRRQWYMGGAIAASLTLALTAQLLLPGLQNPATAPVSSGPAIAQNEAIPGVNIALGQVHKVGLAIKAAMNIDDATFVISLPEGVELSGFPGQRVVRWQGRLKAGKNLLELPVVVNEGKGGVLEARIEHGQKRSVYRVKMAVSDPSRVAI